jgi:hypothetical protein
MGFYHTVAILKNPIVLKCPLSLASKRFQLRPGGAEQLIFFSWDKFNIIIIIIIIKDGSA